MLIDLLNDPVRLFPAKAQRRKGVKENPAASGGLPLRLCAFAGKTFFDPYSAVHCVRNFFNAVPGTPLSSDSSPSAGFVNHCESNRSHLRFDSANDNRRISPPDSALVWETVHSFQPYDRRGIFPRSLLPHVAARARRDRWSRSSPKI